jgi:signal transduction histidine kinase
MKSFLTGCTTGSLATVRQVTVGLLLACALLFSMVASVAAETKKEVTIAVLALRGNDAALKTWSATADYLAQKIPDTTFRIVPYDFKTIGPAAQRGEYDFVIANSSIYVELEALYGVTRIATLQGMGSGRAATLFGGVIFCKNSRSDITTLADIRGKTFGAVEENSFGGWRMAWRELRAAGIDPYRDFKELAFVGTHDGVVLAVRDGKLDVGTARSGILEDMAKTGKINPADFKIIHQQYDDQFNLLHSTRLYPEWPFARLRHTNDALAQKVSIALLSMQPEDGAAQKAEIRGWTTPHDYNDVHELFKELKIGPYRDYGMITLAMVLQKYLYPIVGGLIFVTLLVIFAVFMLRLNDRLNRSNHELEQAHLELKEAQSRLLQNEKMASIGQLAAGVAHEINNPNGFILSNLNALRKYVERVREFIAFQEDVLATADEAVTTQIQQKKRSLKIDFTLEDMGNLIQESREGAERIKTIVKDLKDFSHLDQAELVQADINACIENTLTIISNELMLKTELKKEFGVLPAVTCNPGQINQVLSNLLHNAAQAIEQGGEITIKTWAEQNLVCIAISDTGPGIPPEIRERLFEPFFTTREVGKGAGLGLSIAYDIIKKHNGEITVKSELGKGSCFTVRLPVTES